MKSLRPLVLSLILSAAAAAQTPLQQPMRVQPKPGDFAMQLPLHVSGNNGVVQLQLPLSVYEHAQSSQLADVRVFNAAGDPVPFAFFQPSHTNQAHWRESNVKLFPVFADGGNEQTAPLELNVRASQDGTLLSVHAKTGGKSKDTELSELVLDLGPAQKNEALDSLQLFIPSTLTAGYRANVTIDQSDDLKLWDRVAQSRVDWLKGAANAGELLNDRIALPIRTGRYLRIHWLAGKPLQFSRITARWRSTEKRTDDGLEIILKPSAGKFSGDWTYVTNIAIAANEIGLDLPNANIVLPVSIGFYRQELSPKRRWVFDPIAQNTFYRLNQNGVERVSSRIHISPQGSNEWVVRPQIANAVAPNLVLRWQPRTIVFTAQGDANKEQASFILAFGANADNLKQWLTSESPISLVAPGFNETELNQVEHATAGQPLATSAETKHESAEEESVSAKLNKRTIILWAVLIFGTLLLGAMTWRLFKQMNRENSTEKNA